MGIQKVEVKLFRNLKNCTVELNGNSAFVGNNRLGKTNYLNAISWCLTGYDLAGNCKDLLNVPCDLQLYDGVVCVDVSVSLNKGKITRSVVYCKNTYSQKIAINDIECKTLKEGEQQIDLLLEINVLLPYQNKDFNVRRFLLNPLYFTQCKESAFREFVIKLLNVDETKVYETLPDIYKTLIENRPIALLSQNNDKEIKAVKKSIEYWKNVKDFLTTYNDDKYIGIANDKLNEYVSKLADLSDKNVAIDNYALELSKVYNSACKEAFKHIDMVLLEKGQGEDVWKNVCYVNSPITHTRMEYCSTSEAIISGVDFICKFLEDRPKDLPLLFDEMETLDENSIKLIIERTNTQLITACVKSGLDHIEVRSF